jgi:hypothetical protein
MRGTYILLAVAGLAAVFWGLPASHRLDKPKDLLAALAALAGLGIFLLGLLLAVLPDFFTT